MRLGSTQLGYCTNVHPGESLAQVRDNLARHSSAVRKLVCPDGELGVGLWLSARAAGELAQGGALAELKALLAQHKLYVFTLNGFPYGAFHGRAVKQRVYEPDWRDDVRRNYTDRLAELLAALLPAGMDGSISTLPCAFKPSVRTAIDEQTIALQLLRHAAHLHGLRERTGKRICLAIEPEPCCYHETVAEAVSFFERCLHSARALAQLSALAGVSRAAAAEIVQRHIGLCLDTCHAAVEFESAESIVAALRRANITIAKAQLSSGLRLARADRAARAALAPYLDEVYLHQVVERGQGALVRYLDLPEALAARAQVPDASAPEWRIHFHVPIFLARMRAFDSTQFFLREILALQRAQPLSAHLEVETYTWDVLPEEAKTSDLASAIARELRFCLAELAPAGARA